MVAPQQLRHQRGRSLGLQLGELCPFVSSELGVLFLSSAEGMEIRLSRVHHPGCWAPGTPEHMWGPQS